MLRKALIALLVAGIAGMTASQASAARTVRVGDDWFVRDGSPSTVSVKRGTVVRWRWTGREQHNVVASGAARFQSPLKRSGTFRKKVTRRGTYRIICSIHQPDMRMTLRVR
jgi:plastocyanin